MSNARLTLDADIYERPLGEVPGGLRIDLNYLETNNDFSFDLDPDTETDKAVKLTGKTVAGHDWVLIRNDRVVIFDGRVTVTIAGASGGGQTSRDGQLDAIARIQGRSTLTRAKSAKGEPVESALPAVLGGLSALPEGAILPVEFTLQFTVEFGDLAKDDPRRPALKCLERELYFGFAEYSCKSSIHHIKITARSAEFVADLVSKAGTSGAKGGAGAKRSSGLSCDAAGYRDDG